MIPAVDALVLGAGAAGLACRAALRGRREVVCVERAERPGGLLRVDRCGGYTFDPTVHVLFFRDEAMRRLVIGLFEGRVHRFAKRNLVWQHGRAIGYPYQLHAQQLPRDVREECLQAIRHNPHPAPGPDASLRAWLLHHFGEGFYRHFLGPYNRKLYGVCPSELLAAPMVWTIPPGNREAALRGRGGAGPEVRCLYPAGPRGIAALPDALERLGAGPVLCGEEVVAVSPRRRETRTSSGLRLRYRSLISTLPLPVLVSMTEGAPAEVRAAARSLRAAPVTVVRVGARRAGPGLDAHWTYFADADIPFYRLVRLSRISPDLCPAGGEAVLLECPGREPPDLRRVVELLGELDVIAPESVEHVGWHTIPHAYVLFDRHTEGAVRTIVRYLDSVGIQAAGRYGEWRYANIEQTLISGVRAAGRAGGGLKEAARDFR